MSGTWSTCIFLLIFIAAAGAQTCVVKYNNVIITDFAAGVDGESIADTTLGDVLVDDKFSLENVLDVTISAEIDNSVYLQKELLMPDALKIYTSTTFETYEESEDVAYMRHIITFQCTGEAKELIYRNLVTLSNNKSPIFENENDGSNGYKYSLPMPFPSGISIPKAYNEILAYDDDIGTNDIEFILTGTGSGYFDVTWSAVVGTDLKTRYSADIIPKNHLYLTTPLTFTITAKTPVGAIATTVQMEIENAENGVNYDIQVTAPVGGAPITDDLFSATYDMTTKFVTLNLDRQLTVDEELNEVFTIRLEATDPSNVQFLAETIVYVDVRAIQGAFSSDLFVSNIDDPDMAADTALVTEPLVIEILSVPSDNIIVELVEPYPNAVWVDDQFYAEYRSGGTVVIKLKKKLTQEALDLPSINLLLKATETGTIFEARTLVQVNMPTIVTDQISFNNILYNAEISSPGMQSGELPTSEPITLSSCDSTTTVDLLQQDSLPFWDDQFSVQIDSSTCIVTLSLAKQLTQAALAEEILVLQLRAKDGTGADLAKTLIQVDIPLTIYTEATTAFSSPLYTSSIITETENVIDHIIVPNEEIKFKATPIGTVTLELKVAPGEALSYPENYGATYDSGTGSVTIKLIQMLSGEALSAEVHVMTLAASVDGTLQSETLIYIDIVPTSIPPPVVDGEFTSALYTSEITDPESLQELPTNEEIIIANPPNDVIVTLEDAPASTPSYASNFMISEPDANGRMILSLVAPLPPEASDNSYLVLILHAASPSIVDYFEESVIHVKLPAMECSISTSTCPSWASCPPCLCTTPLPSGSITFDQATYISTTTHDSINVVLFTVQAEHSSGSGSFTYEIDYGGVVALEDSIQIDPTSGEVKKNAFLAPGRYDFRVTALHSTGDQASNPAIIYVESIGTCEDGSTCFEYAVVVKQVNEAEDIEILPANNAPISCTYSFVDIIPDLASPWFDLDQNTGQLSIKKESDLEALLQAQKNPEIYVEITVGCEDPTAAPSHPVLREVPPQISVTRQEMVVVITLLDKNDQIPIFLLPELAVAYPDLDLARQLLPGPIAAVTASDKDSDDSLEYSLATVSSKYSVHPETGKLYPVDGVYNYVDETVIVAAFDKGNNRAEIKYQLRHVTHSEIAALTIVGAWLEDEAAILDYITTNLPGYTWGSLKSAVLAEPPNKQITPELQSRLLRSAERAGNTGGMFLVLYAINEKLKPLSYDEIAKLLEDLPPSGTWEVRAVETWEESTGNPAPISSGYRAATIALGIITGLLLLALVFVIYLFVVRKKQKEKLRAKAGFKNRTSFSNQGVLENGNAQHHDDHSIHEDGLKLPETLSEQEERRKSMVTFSDEPEVIPGQSVRL